jgi:amidohydrolase
MLLGAAKVLAARRDQLCGTVKFLFQPAEEGPGGALPMIEAGVLEDPAVDAVIGAHVQTGLATGIIGVREGHASAASDTAHIKIIGVGGHGAHPHVSVDSVAVSAQVVNALQTVVSRETEPIDPVVLTIGTIQGGYRANIIAPEVEMSATVRSMKEETRQKLPKGIERVVAGVCQAMKADYEFEYSYGYGPLYNDPEVTGAVREAAAAIVGEDSVVEVSPTMGAEDFSYFASECPGTFFRVGVRNEEKGITYPGHHPHFDIDEDALPIGTAVMAFSAWRLLHGA